MTDKNQYLDLIDAEDFGFSFKDDKELKKIEVHYASLGEEVVDLRKRLVALRAIFLPLLEDLNREPDKALIKWPGRKPIIDKQIQNLKSLTDV